MKSMMLAMVVFLSLLVSLCASCGEDSVMKCACTCQYNGGGAGACGNLQVCDFEEVGCLAACVGVCEGVSEYCKTTGGQEKPDSPLPCGNSS